MPKHWQNRPGRYGITITIIRMISSRTGWLVLALLWLMLSLTATASAAAVSRSPLRISSAMLDEQEEVEAITSSFEANTTPNSNDAPQPVLRGTSERRNDKRADAPPLSLSASRFLQQSGENDGGDDDEMIIPACGQVLATLATVQVRELLLVMVEDHLDLTEAELLLVKLAVLTQVDFGVKVIKVCGKCTDFTNHGTRTERSGSLCRNDDYAANVTHSGLLILPLQRDSSSALVTGTLPVTILCHGTSASNLAVPSNLWNTTDGLVFFGTIFTALTGTITLMPDYTGYAESRHDAYRAYLIKRGYATATLPLLWQTEAYLRNTTNCQTAPADAFMMVGYSEGGYAAVALAELFSTELGHAVDIIQVRAGGAPLRLSTEQLKFLFQQVTQGTFDNRRRYYVALLGAAYSSTTTDVVNYNTSQDLVDAAQRDTVLEAIREDGAARSAINEIIPRENPLAILEHNMTVTFQRALEAGETDPCVTSSVLGETDLLCQAMKEQDLIEIVNQSPYPVILCHSKADTLVSFGNLPTQAEVSNNKRLEIQVVEGGHESAALGCFVQSLLYYGQSNLRNYPVDEIKHNVDGCPDDSSDADNNAGLLDQTAGPSAATTSPGLGSTSMALFVIGWIPWVCFCLIHC